MFNKQYFFSKCNFNHYRNYLFIYDAIYEKVPKGGIQLFEKLVLGKNDCQDKNNRIMFPYSISFLNILSAEFW